MNNASRVIASTLGVIFGISGINHGFFEVLQRNTPTKGMFINAIGDAQRMWPHGSEPAFTLIPNYLVTGIIAMLVGLLIVIVSLWSLSMKYGPSVLLSLFILLLLTGGGVAQILFFPWIWLLATRINKPLTWWRKTLKGKFFTKFGTFWRYLLTLSAALLTFALVVAITGFIPGLEDPEAVLTAMLICLCAEIILLPLTFIAGFVNDITHNPIGDAK